MNKIRCGWCGTDPLYVKYHDEEWGKPVYDDRKLFEFLILETFQAGLSWLTILRKRENFRTAFDNFDYKKVAEYAEDKIAQLMGDPGIIRNGLKIKAAVSNAKAFMDVQKEFGTFSNYIWGFTDGKTIPGNRRSLAEVPATSRFRTPSARI
jgi:DNA-3-methyladenine glycosylase I